MKKSNVYHVQQEGDAGQRLLQEITFGDIKILMRRSTLFSAQQVKKVTFASVSLQSNLQTNLATCSYFSIKTTKKGHACTFQAYSAKKSPNYYFEIPIKQSLSLL